ncbi:restriction endonuclease subunit S [Nostoc sp. CHAB 5844]|nr:restriction endonuclease subunit S [Nostoc sp. CHAB 5844]
MMIPKLAHFAPDKMTTTNIFFATMRKSAKDNSGDKIWRKISSSTASSTDEELSDLMPPSPVQRVVGVESDFLRDNHEHLVVDHDLYNHEGLTEDGIAEAFIEFAKKENLSFFELSPSVAPFDAVKYQRLMDGLEATEVNFQRVCYENEEFRIDSEYYHPLHLVYESLVTAKEHDRLGKLCNLIAGPFGSTVTTDNYVEDEEFRYIRGKDVQDFFLDDSDPVYVERNLFDSLSQFHLKALDILVTVVGMNFGKTALVLPKDCPAIFSCKSTLLKNSEVNPYFLVTYLSCKHGYRLIRRGRRGAAQPGINLFDLRTVPVPIFSRSFQDQVEMIVNNYCQSLKEESKELYQQAEDLLLSELGLKDWQPTEETFAVKSFAESFLSSGRLDAEYYQPKFYEVESKIKANGFVLIKDICSHINYGSVPTSSYTDNGEGIPYIKGLNLKDTEIVSVQLDRIINTESLPSQVYTKKGDIVISQMGTVGNCGVVEDEQAGWIFASFTIRIRLKNQANFNPHFVALYIDKVARPYYLMRNIAQASVRQNTDLPTIKNMYIPLVAKDVQLLIAEKMQNGKDAKSKSKQLLEIAKTGVERAIETDEATATTWMNQQLEAIGINVSN